MGKHAQSRGRYSAWSHSRVFLALESGGQHRTGLGGGLCIRLSVWYAFFLCQFHMVSRQSPGRLKELLRKFDHGAIYLHIAGTYTPFTLLVMRHAGGWGWGIFSFVWLSAIVGFILSFKKLKEHSNLETVCYLAMGASILVAMKPLMDNLTEMGAVPAFWWLIGGGASYIIGAVFYSLRKPYMHATFHLFCLGGSIGHMIAIWLIL